MRLSLAVPDWEDRIRRGLSLVPRIDINPAEQRRAVKLFERLRLPDVVGKPALATACGDWFKDIIGPALGALDPENGARIIRGIFLLAPKKSSKTTYGAGGMMTALLMNKRPNGEFLFTGPTHDISEIAYGAADGMIEADDDWCRQENGQEGYLKKVLHSRDHLKTIEHRLTGASLKIKTFDMDVATGVKPVGVLVDELHIIAKDKNAARVLGQLRGGRISNPEAFFWIITTQSDEPPVGVMAVELKKARAIRDGLVHGDTLSVLYEFPSEIMKPGSMSATPRWYDSALWPMVTPNLDRSVTIDVLEKEFEEAKQSGEVEIRRWASQHLNIEIGIGLHNDRWAGSEFWERRADRTLTLDELIDRCELIIVGLDGGGLDDLYGFYVLGREKAETEVEIEVEEDGVKRTIRQQVKRWLGWGHAWCHRGVLERRKSIASTLQDFAKDGDLTIVDDELADISGIVAIIEKIKDAGLLYCAAVDPAGLGEMIDALAQIEIIEANKEQGRNFVIGAKQGFAMMNAIKTAERKLANGTFVHADQGLMDWCVGNVKIERLATAIRATKQSAGDAKIDPWMAMINCASMMQMNPQCAPALDIAAMVA